MHDLGTQRQNKNDGQTREKPYTQLVSCCNTRCVGVGVRNRFITTSRPVVMGRGGEVGINTKTNCVENLNTPAVNTACENRNNYQLNMTSWIPDNGQLSYKLTQD